MVKMNNLKVLYSLLEENFETRTVFTCHIYDKVFHCVFLIDIQPFRLYIFTPNNLLSLEFEVKDTFEMDTFIKDKSTYNKLCTYLDIKYGSKNYPFKPTIFFAKLNNSIQTNNIVKPEYYDVIRTGSRHRNIEEPEKIYFMGWRRTPYNQRISQSNIEKTRMAFGEKYVKFSIKYHLSSRWTDNQADEDLTKLNLI